MLAHLFKRDESHLYCLSNDSQGRNIPEVAGGSWRHVKMVELHPREQRLSVDSDAAIADIAQRGYHFVEGWYRQL